MKQRIGDGVLLVVMVGLVAAARVCNAITYIPTEDGFTISFQGETVGH